MAANPLSPCDPATSWYGFAYSLSWSNECEVAEVLSDIPFISVGILAFATSALFVVAKRVSISTILLFSSVLLSFVAAVLDTGKTLADGAGINTAVIANAAVVRTREVLFALSTGFRFLFYWSHVAEPPRKELSALSPKAVQKINFFTLERSHGPHSGSWARWGFPGKLLGVGLLVAIITIMALQIVWRVSPQFHQYSSVYGTDAALQLLVSFLLLLKLLSNTLDLNSPDSMLVHTFRECLLPISGLVVNIAIGVGDILSFAFTESTVGRLLQAFEVCIIVTFVVAAAFLKHRDILLSATPLHRVKKGDVPFKLPEPARGSTFRVTPPLIETPRISMILGAATIQNKPPSLEALHWSARRSMNHVSSWLSSRVSRIRARYEDEEVRLWNAEHTKVDPPYTGNTYVSSTQEPRNPVELLRDASANANCTSVVSVRSTLVRSMKGSIHSGQTLHPGHPLIDIQRSTVPPPLQITAAPVLSISSPASPEVKHTVAIPEASAVYGESHSNGSDSWTLDEVLRQQEQLDRSIEALKLFSARASNNSLQPATSPKSVELSRSPSIGQRTVSSEVSLSSFPVPPWLTTPVPSLPSSRLTSVKRIRGDRRARLALPRPAPVQDTYASLTSISSASLVDIPTTSRLNSIPRSPFGGDNESLSAEAGKSSLFNSGVTEYNVTSFIGGLATPGEPGRQSQEKPWFPREHEPSVEAIQTDPGVKKFPPGMLLVPPPVGLLASPAAAKLPPLASPTMPSRDDLTNVLQHRSSGQILPSVLVGPSPRTSATDHAEKSVVISLIGPPLAYETSSPPTALGNRDDRAQRMFVRPRPPPLIIKSYREQPPDIPRVQVLADD